MTQTLEERAAEVAEALKNASKGEWEIFNIASPLGVSSRIYADLGDERMVDICHIPKEWNRGNVPLLAHAKKMAELIADQQARIRELEARSQWQPIETAPKDGTCIDIWYEFRVKDSSLYSRITDCWWDNEMGWVFEDNDSDYLYSKVQNPTHWMPLPKPPVTEGDNA